MPARAHGDFSLLFLRGLCSTKVWPRTSITVDSVCCAVFDAMSLALSFISAPCNIWIFTIFLFSSCLEISFIVCGDAPSLPTHIVGFSRLSSRFIRFFALDEIVSDPLLQSYLSHLHSNSTKEVLDKSSASYKISFSSQGSLVLQTRAKYASSDRISCFCACLSACAVASVF